MAMAYVYVKLAIRLFFDSLEMDGRERTFYRHYFRILYRMWKLGSCGAKFPIEYIVDFFGVMTASTSSKISNTLHFSIGFKSIWLLRYSSRYLSISDNLLSRLTRA